MSEPFPFRVGSDYGRKDIFELLGIPDPKGGNWYTGYTSHGDDWFIFCGIEIAGRTGHNYHNHFSGDELVWFGKTGSNANQPSIKAMTNPAARVYLFYREDDRQAFTFAGLARAISVDEANPVSVVWSFSSERVSHPEILPNEITPFEKVYEGARKQITVNTYERDPNARKRCLKKWGLACSVCSFEFSQAYGDLGAGFIHVHHLRPLNEIGEKYELDPENELRPVCPNCHAMLHRKSPTLSIEELKAIINRHSEPIQDLVLGDT